MSVTTLSERLELMRLGDEVEAVFLLPDRSLYRGIALLEGEVIKVGAAEHVVNPRQIWITLDKGRFEVTDECGVLNPKTIAVTFIRHSEVSQVKKISIPLPKPPAVKPVITPEAVKPVFRPIPRDPRTIGIKNELG